MRFAVWRKDARLKFLTVTSCGEDESSYQHRLRWARVPLIPNRVLKIGEALRDIRGDRKRPELRWCLDSLLGVIVRRPTFPLASH